MGVDRDQAAGTAHPWANLDSHQNDLITTARMRVVVPWEPALQAKSPACIRRMGKAERAHQARVGDGHGAMRLCPSYG